MTRVDVAETVDGVFDGALTGAVVGAVVVGAFVGAFVGALPSSPSSFYVAERTFLSRRRMIYGIETH